LPYLATYHTYGRVPHHTYLLSFRLIPPLVVLNGVFRTGEHDAGMSGGCVWEPFDIDSDEYEELAGELQACGVRSARPSEWVQNRVNSQLWTFEFEVGIPAMSTIVCGEKTKSGPS